MENREIKCRALDYEGNWAYGAYIYDSVHKKHFIISCGIHGLQEKAVKPKTIGEYSGLKDKLGKQIWEGDIVLIANGERQVVVYQAPQFIMKEKIKGGFSKCWTEFIVAHTQRQFEEVIGNIHITPELLEEK